jgi:peptide/nickel transport system ATP-binding protein
MSIPDHILLRVHDLSIGFYVGDQVKVAVSGITFDIDKGKTLGIVGESGSGKSVSSLSLMQLLQKDKAVFLSGEVFIHMDLLTNQVLDPARCVESHYRCAPDDPIFAHLRGHAIAMIFQEPMTALNPVMRCGDQIMEMWRNNPHIGRQEARQKTLALFQDVLLPTPDQMMERYPHELSGGQRQRVMIAMAMACQPQLIIADEPTTALDVTVQKEILELLKRLQKQHGMAMIFITHDLGVVRHMADDLVVMRRGQLVESGKAEQVLNSPRAIYTQALLACRPQWGKKWRRLPTIADMEAQTVRMEEQAIGHYDRPLLRVVDLTKTYVSHQGFFGQKRTEFQAVKQVTFDIMQGETLGLVGESGCGKTTLSRMLLGLIPATSGEVWYNGLDLLSASKDQWRQVRKDLQIIFQDPYSALNPKISVGDAILEPMVVRGFHQDAAGRIREMRALLDKVGLPSDAAAKYPHEFSGGQRQRIVIARALATQPKWIICDESVSALDVSVQAQVLNLLNDLKRDFGLTYLFISHDLSVIYQMCDRIMVMQKGAIQELDRADRVFFSPESDYTQRLLQATMSV